MKFEFWQQPSSGANYIRKFLAGEGDETALKILEMLGVFEKSELSTLLRTQDIKKITKELFEIRIKLKNKNYRFIFAIRGSISYILEAFIKKTNKTPKRYIETAERRLKILD